jgi:hypothetical protein
MLAQGLVRPNKRGRRELDCIAAALIIAVAGCGDDLVHPLFPDSTRSLGWQLSATTQWVRSIWGDRSGEVFALCRWGILHYDGSSWSQTGMPEPEFSDIWGNSADDVFAVGSKGSISHYDGNVWTAMATPTWQPLHAVWGTAANDIYAVGESSTILHYDGVHWRLGSPADSNAEPLLDVWGSSSSDVFVVAAHRIYHYDGSSWSVSLEEGGSVIWGNAADDVFVGGSNGAIHHYDGHSWTRIESGIQSDILGAWGSSSNDMYFVGRSALFHWDGSTFTERMKFVNDWWLGAIWGRSPTDIFVGGLDFRHYDGTAWRQVLGIIFEGGIDAVGVVSDSGLLIATRPDEDYWETYGYDGIEWKYLGEIEADISIGGIWGTSFSDIFVTGTHGNDGDSDQDGYDDGYIWHYDGVNWEQSRWFHSGLRGIWGTSGSDIFAVGNDGIIVHYDGSTWSPMSSGTTINLHGVWGSSSTDVFAVGNTSEAGSPVLILHYDGSAWSEMGRYKGPYTVRRIWGSSNRDVYISGWGNSLHYDGSTWSPVRVGFCSDFDLDIWGRSADDVYAASRDCGVLHYSASRIVPGARPTWRPLHAASVGIREIWGTRTDLFGVGYGGVYRLGTP